MSTKIIARKLLICVPLCSAALVVHANPSAFEDKQIYGSGAANVAPAFGGEYLYKTPAGDGRAIVPAIFTGQVKRQVYQFFSAEEEKALIQYKAKQQAEIHKAKLAAYHIAGSSKKTPENLRWPRVIVRDADICVPELASSESSDWKDHLICHQSGREFK